MDHDVKLFWNSSLLADGVSPRIEVKKIATLEALLTERSQRHREEVASTLSLPNANQLFSLLSTM